MDRSHIVEVPSWFLTIRFVQIGLSILVLLLNAIGLALFSFYGGPGYGIFTVRQITHRQNCSNSIQSIATVIICAYYIISVKSKPELYNYIAIVILEVFMVIWWLSAFSVTAWVASAFSIFGAEVDGRWHGSYICFALSAVASAVEW
jgi:hypothetical protein